MKKYGSLNDKVRITLLVVLDVGSFFEAGICTALAFLLIFLVYEINEYLLRQEQQ